jgi:hypothetical protein
MFSSLLRRSSNRRLVASEDGQPLPSPGPSDRRRLSAPRHATADFTEADDDDDDDDDEDDRRRSQLRARVRRFNSDNMDLHGGSGRGDGDDDPDEPDHDDEDGNDIRRRPSLPVLPLFSSTHLGS